jgi:[acyl-carrier-protein] S-malonyltransferase
MKKIAFLFPGQGSQKVGMGSDFYNEYSLVRELYDMAEETVKLNLSRICFQGPMETLTETVNLQPALTVVNLSVLAAIQQADLKAQVTAGHSLGEYSALAAAQVVTREDVFAMVMKRGELMHRESLRRQGAMHAIVGLEIEDVQAILPQVQENGIVSIANHNMRQQVVITGSPEAVEAASAIAKSQGARTVALKVSGAWHSELIRGAENDFQDHLQALPFGRPVVPVIHNVTAEVTDDPDEIRKIMVQQLCSPVRWYDTMCKLIDDDVEVFVEVGPGKVLTGLLRKTIPKDYPARLYAVNDLKSLEVFLKDTS